MQPSDQQLLVARLLDMFHRRALWQRRLWRVGTILSLEEAAEYGEAVEGGGLRPEGLNYVCDRAKLEVHQDGGLPQALKEHLANALDPKSLVTRGGRDSLTHLTARGGETYLDTWRTTVAEAGLPGIEGPARAIASHLLDSDLSPDHLHRWLTAVQQDLETSGVAALVEDAKRVHDAVERGYSILVPFESLPDGANAFFEVMSSQKAVGWIEATGASSTNVRMSTALLFEQRAKDPWRAVEKVADLVARLMARAAVGAAGEAVLAPSGVAFVQGKRDTFRLGSPRRSVEVHALSRQNALFDVRPRRASGLIDDALELVSAMDQGAPGAAITGGWAAVEGLLAESGAEGPRAADRMASLIACSFPRAELTTLSYRHGSDDALAEGLASAASNHDRAAILERHLRAGGDLLITDVSDIAALRRMRKLLDDPSDVLTRIRDYCAQTLRRLYNQRNIVMHGGSLTSVALQATLSLNPPF